MEALQTAALAIGVETAVAEKLDLSGAETYCKSRWVEGGLTE